jgi:ppGpp synthetase/RelA/SpoT-type nucleotidyltranferase
MTPKRKVTSSKQIEDYRQNRQLHIDFANAIKAILGALLSTNNYNYQAVFARAKEIDSLEKKLKNHPEKTYKEIQDLAGCRVLFYLDESIDQFAQLLSREFKLVYYENKYSANDYNATHVIVEMSDARNSLTEYSRFKGMKCEIQLTTPLYQAWADLAHDIIYKPPEGLSDFDEYAFDALKKKFSEVMEQHIKKASYAFGFIYKQFEKIQEGKQVFDPQFLEGITRLKSNNEIYEKFGDKGVDQLDTTDVVSRVLKNSKNNKVKPINTGIGNLPGHTYSDIAEVCVKILGVVKYQRIEKSMPLLADLTNSDNQEISKSSLGILHQLSEYNLRVLEKYGYAAQVAILSLVEKWSNEMLVDHEKAVIEMMKSILEVEFEGQDMSDENTMSFQFGPLPVNENLKKIRDRAITILIRLYSKSDGLTTRNEIIEALGHASYLPFRGKYKDDMKEMVTSNTDQITNFYLEKVPTADLETLRTIETQLASIEERFPNKK